MRRRRLLSGLVVLLYCANLLSAAVPTFVSNGSATVTNGTGSCTPTFAWSPALEADDIIVVVGCGEGSDDGVGVTLATAQGFAEVPTVSPQNGSDADSTEENPELNCAVFWKRAVGSDVAPTIADSGDHTSCAGHLFRGAKKTGNPWNVTSGGNDGNVNDTSAVIPGATTTADDVLVVLIQGTSNNATVTTNCGTATNADLGSITERFDSSHTSGLGSGHCVITGTKVSSGSYADSTLTMSATTYKAAFSIALEPEPPSTCTAGLNMMLLGVGGCP